MHNDLTSEEQYNNAKGIIISSLNSNNFGRYVTIELQMQTSLVLCEVEVIAGKFLKYKASEYDQEIPQSHTADQL